MGIGKRIPVGSPNSFFGHLKDRAYCIGEPLPVPDPFFEPLAPETSKPVELRFAPTFGFSPFRGDDALVLKTMQRGVERPTGHLDHRARNLLQALSDRVAMYRA